MTIINPRSSLNAAVPFAKRTDAVAFAGSDPLLRKLSLVGDWSIEWAGAHRGPFRLEISAPRIIEVSDERAGRLPGFRTSRAGWLRRLQLEGVRAEECPFFSEPNHYSCFLPMTPQAAACKDERPARTSQGIAHLSKKNLDTNASSRKL